MTADTDADDAMIVIYWCGAITKPVPEVAFATEKRMSDLKLWKEGRPGNREYVVITLSEARCMLDKTFKSGRFQVNSASPNVRIQGYVISVAGRDKIYYDQLGMSLRGYDAIKLYGFCFEGVRVLPLERVINAYGRLSFRAPK